MIEKTPFWVSGVSAVLKRLPVGRYRSLEYLGAFKKTPFWATLPASTGGARSVADLRDSICREACFTGQYEPQETLLIQRLLASGMSFLDVGANWGYFTLVAASRVGPAGTVVSLEPDPRLFETLSKNVRENRFTQVITLPLAAATARGKLTLRGYDEAGNNWGASQIVATPGNSATNFEVNAVTLDEIIRTHLPKDVDVMKMDIEGAEDAALIGLSDCLRRGICRSIILELHPSLLESKGSSSEKTLSPLRDFHYDIYRIDHSHKMTRSAAYSRPKRVKSLLSPLNTKSKLDSWPHLFCLAPTMRIEDLYG